MLIVQCCVCHRVRLDQEWVLTRLAAADQSQVSHGYCPSCSEAAIREIRASREQRHGFPQPVVSV